MECHFKTVPQMDPNCNFITFQPYARYNSINIQWHIYHTQKLMCKSVKFHKKICSVVFKKSGRRNVVNTIILSHPSLPQNFVWVDITTNFRKKYLMDQSLPFNFMIVQFKK